MKLIKQFGIRSSQLLVICALCIYVIFSMTGMSVHKDRLRKVLRQETRQSNMAVPLVEGNPVVNGSLYRRDVGLPHEVQRTEPLNTKERSTSLLPPSGDIYLGKQSLGALVRPDDMWVLEEPPNSTVPLSHVKLEELPLIKDTFTEPSKCPRTIGSVSRYSTWFNARYQEGVKIFLDFEDVRNYTVFRKLEHYGLPFGFRGQRRQQLADILGNPNFTNPRLFLPGERPRCLSCAVVGSGGILNGSNAGKEIDSHDLVLRLNKADSRGRYAKDVGIKTSLYTFFPESMGADLVRDKNALFAFTMFKSFDVDYAEKMVNEDSDFIFVTKDNKSKTARKPPISPGRLKIVHPDFFRYVHSRYLDGKALRPTTGALVVMMAVHLCDEVTIYGFGYDSRFSLHYYDQQFVTHNKNLTSCHDVHNELGLWQKLHEEGVIRFFHRDM